MTSEVILVSRADRQYQEQWINSHITVAQKTLKKPVVLEEFGEEWQLDGPSEELDEVRDISRPLKTGREDYRGLKFVRKG